MPVSLFLKSNPRGKLPGTKKEKKKKKRRPSQEERLIKEEEELESNFSAYIAAPNIEVEITSKSKVNKVLGTKVVEQKYIGTEDPRRRRLSQMF